MAEPAAVASTGKTVTLPLNSKRVVLRHLRLIAKELGLPSSASASDLRTLIEAKLEEEGREPPNVQVQVRETASGGIDLALCDAGGIFLEVAEEEEVPADGGLGVEKKRTDGSEEEKKPDPATMVATLRDSLREATERGTRLAVELEESRGEVERLTAELAAEKKRRKEIWKLNCEQVAGYDAECALKDEELAALRQELHDLKMRGVTAPSGEPRTPASGEPTVPLPGERAAPTSGESETRTRVSETGARDSDSREASTTTRPTARRGKAPPIDSFTSENREVRLDDWLPTLERAATWNGWSDEEKLMQLAGHLRGRAAQEWSLIAAEDRRTYTAAIESLQARLDPVNRIVVAQDFRHATQTDTESVEDFVRRLERLFQVAYGRDGMNSGAREALLYGQLHDGLKYELIQSPAVSGAQSYKQLCLCAKTEEERLAGLKKHQLYQRNPPKKQVEKDHSSSGTHEKSGSSGGGQKPKRQQRRCYNCNAVGHLAKDCSQPKKESSAKTGKSGAQAKVVTTVTNPRDLLYSSESEGEVHMIRVKDEGSQPRLAAVNIQGVEALGIIDSGADITIINGALFQEVAAKARLRKKAFRDADKIPYAYDERPFQLHGCIDLDIAFDGRTLCTPVYVKMDAKDPLLLSEGVCRQLGILTYHPLVFSGRDKVKKSPVIPTVRIRLINSVRVPAQQSVLACVAVEGEGNCFLVEPDEVEEVTLADSLVEPSPNGTARVLLVNQSGFTRKLDQGQIIGEATQVEVWGEGADEEELPHTDAGDEEESQVDASGEAVHDQPDGPTVAEVTSQDRKSRLAELLSDVGPTLPWQERAAVHEVLLQHHDVFSLDDGDRGETDLVEMEIDTGDSPPVSQSPRRVPFAARKEIAKQLQAMQDHGVIQESNSPWASPVVLVRKKDGSLRFCIDYRELNAVTKTDSHPLPRIDDLLDQLGRAKYFTTLDLASGYWQVKVHRNSIQKTGFVTHRGLFEFRVMPFGLKNAPAVFQRLMQRVLDGLDPDDEFVSVYIDDILIFSETLEEHLERLRAVLARLRKAKLKLKPAKCHFMREQVEHLGYVITREGLKPNPTKVAAVKDFPVPQSVKAVRQFMGLASYYRRFIRGFASIAEPLHALTRKGAPFTWTTECQESFDELKEKLSSAPVLSYPDFDLGFVLETDACGKGLGAILSQKQPDGRTHPVAYASRALSPAEKRYGITDLETLAVVWAITHFRAYIYGHDVVVYTDHSAVRAVLQTPSPSGKHARWWSRVFGSGAKSLQIVYRAGRENVGADALSRHPVGAPPTQPTVEDSTVLKVSSQSEIPELLEVDPSPVVNETDFAEEQSKDADLKEIICFLRDGDLPTDASVARKLTTQAEQFVLVDGVLYFLDAKQQYRKRCVVPSHLRLRIMEENHSSPMAGHFAGPRLYKALIRHWWWPGMYTDVVSHCANCPQCAIVNSSGRVNRPPLCPIPVSRPFQIVGVDIMELPRTDRGNRYVVVFQDFLTKFPLVYPVSNQKALCLARLLVEEVIPLFGVPEALLSDRGTNLLSCLMTDICKMMGTKKLNTTAYHPQCNGMVERFNRTLKTILRKHADRFGKQWDRFLSGVLWAYRNTPHASTNEKPSFLLYGINLRTPTEAAFLSSTPPQLTDIVDYREELSVSLTSARELAAASIRKAQQTYKKGYDTKARDSRLRVGDWVLVYFPADETGKARKLSRPWHGPYRVVSVADPDVSVAKVFFPQDGTICVHQTRVRACPPEFPGGFYWYGERRQARRPPRWVARVLEDLTQHLPEEPTAATQSDDSSDEMCLDLLDSADSNQDQDADLDPCPVPEPDPMPDPMPNPMPDPSCRYPLRSRSRRTH